MPASLIIFVHFTNWTSLNFPSSSGEEENASKPSVALFALISGLSMIFRSSVLSFVTTSCDVPTGAKKPPQASMSKSVRPASSSVGRSGAIVLR